MCACCAGSNLRLAARGIVSRAAVRSRRTKGTVRRCSSLCTVQAAARALQRPTALSGRRLREVPFNGETHDAVAARCCQLRC
jgi:hypothetical protein